MMYIAIIFFVIGRLVFLVKADFDIPGTWWDDAYYIWDAANYCFLFATINSLSAKRYRFLTKPILYFSIIRLSWEITSHFTTMEVNHPRMVTMLFTILILIVIIWLIKDLRDLAQRDL